MGIVLGFIGYILFLVVGLICIRCAHILFGSYLNITTVFIFPFLCVCSLQVIVTGCYHTMLFPSIRYWEIIILFFSVTLLIEYVLFRILRMNKNEEVIYNDMFGRNIYFLVFVSFYLLYMLYDTYKQISSMELTMIIQDEFAEDYGGSGGFYSRLFLLICATFFMGYTKKWYGYLIGIICLIPSLVLNTKGIILMPILASFIVKAYNGQLSKITRKILIIGFLGVFIFFGSYMWEFSIYEESPLTDTGRWQQIFEKFMSYLLSGVQGFNINLQQTVDETFDNIPNITLAPVNNMLSKLGIGHSVSVVNPISFSIGLSSVPDEESNVNTHIGTLYLFNGLLGGLIVHAFCISCTMIIKKTCQLLNNNSFFVVLYSLFLTGFALGWFEFYFMHTFWSYFIIITIILFVCFYSKKNSDERMSI